MSILKDIIETKRREVEEAKVKSPLSMLLRSDFFERRTLSLSGSLNKSSTGIISEFKRKSPSKGFLNRDASVIDIACGYEEYGASGISILTDKEYFGANENDFTLARRLIKIPILRKEFIIDAYQIYEAKSIGADVILLIASAISVEECKRFSKIAKSLNLEVLLEVHSEDELSYINDEIDMVGVNNRNLSSFVTDIDLSYRLSNKISKDFVKVSESGISNASEIIKLRDHGYRGFLIGETFMKSNDPSKSLKNFLERL